MRHLIAQMKPPGIRDSLKLAYGFETPKLASGRGANKKSPLPGALYDLMWVGLLFITGIGYLTAR